MGRGDVVWARMRRAWQRYRVHPVAKSLVSLDRRVVDGGLVLALAALTFIDNVTFRPNLVSDYLGELLPIGLLTLPLMARRRHPLASFAVVTGGFVLLQQVSRHNVLAVLALLLGAYSVSVYAHHRAAGIGACAAAALVTTWFGPSPAPPPLIVACGVLGGACLAGLAVRGRHLSARTWQNRAVLLERRQEESRLAALRAERSRIARELHDLVTHTVTVMVIQAGAARHVAQRQPEQVPETLRLIEDCGHEALDELRRLLGLLTEDYPSAELTPTPGLDQLTALVHRVSEAGLPVDLHVERPQQQLPAGLDLAAYRVIQEALTNVLKHAPHAATTVAICQDNGELQVRIDNDASDEALIQPGAVAGHGLIGMRERVTLYGGNLRTGRGEDGRFHVHARFPVNSTGTDTDA